MARAAKGIVIAAPNSGSGKTLITLGICRALVDLGIAVAPAKTGPDYIDPTFLARAAGQRALNLDPWAMPPDTIKGLAAEHAANADMLVVEGVMGLFDGAMSGVGSTADLAATLDLPIILTVDCSHMAQSVAALVEGFARHRRDINIAGVILNKVGSAKHEKMLRDALGARGIEVLGALHRNPNLKVPERHLGLTLPTEVEDVEQRIVHAGELVASAVDLDVLQSLAKPVSWASPPSLLSPLGQKIAIAQDAAFAFIYEHQLNHWRSVGAELSFFSPLADESPDQTVDAIFLPGGYPELHGDVLAAATSFKTSLTRAKANGALIYGECGGFMVMGQTLTDKVGKTHQMAGLLPVESAMDRPKRTLGYRHLTHHSPLPWPKKLTGHEFHYSSAKPSGLPELFSASDAAGEGIGAMGMIDGRTMGSYAHVIGAAP